MTKWLTKGEEYVCRNGNVGIFKGTWISTAKGIRFVIEDKEGRAVGYIDKKDLK